ncbi:MAG TPA: hypothetical protein VGI93_09425 [Steroidobacteraceae bacterium]|jgi:hypothetical protein
MVLPANDRLDDLYAIQRVLQEEVNRLQVMFDTEDDLSGSVRRYILNIQIEALQEEGTKLSARISDILERDLQR